MAGRAFPRYYYPGITAEQIRKKFYINLPCKCHEQYENRNKDTSYYVTLTFNDVVEPRRGRRLRKIRLICECCNRKSELYYDRIYQSEIDW